MLVHDILQVQGPDERGDAAGEAEDKLEAISFNNHL